MVDKRIGSGDLYADLITMGLQVELTTLPFADVAFEGRGAKGKPVDIGVELKKVNNDLISSLRTGRLSGHQLPGLVGPKGAYDYAWVLVEGKYKVNTVGQLVVEKWKGRHLTWAPAPGGMNAAELEKKLLTLELCGGLHVRFCPDRSATLHFLRNLYRWWSDKSLDSHTSHLLVHTPTTFLPVSDFRACVQRFPHIGQHASLAVEARFCGNLRDACNAGVEQWAGIVVGGKSKQQRRLGTSAAKDIVDFVNGRAGN